MTLGSLGYHPITEQQNQRTDNRSNPASGLIQVRLTSSTGQKCAQPATYERARDTQHCGEDETIDWEPGMMARAMRPITRPKMIQPKTANIV